MTPRKGVPDGSRRLEVVSRAHGPADLLHARSPAYARRVEDARATIAEATAHGRIVVAYSGGKDSTVLLDLVRQVAPDAIGMWIDSGAEYPETADMARKMDVHRVHPVLNMHVICKSGGYWGYDGPLVVDPDLTHDFQRELLEHPCERFMAAMGAGVLAMGLAMRESTVRRMTGYKRGTLYYAKTHERWHLCPLMEWRDADVWAYIASEQLDYHPVYDRMTALGIPRDRQRVSTLLDVAYATHGRFAQLRQAAPDAYARLVADYPKIGRMT